MTLPLLNSALQDKRVDEITRRASAFFFEFIEERLEGVQLVNFFLIFLRDYCRVDGTRVPLRCKLDLAIMERSMPSRFASRFLKVFKLPRLAQSNSSIITECVTC